MVCQPQKIKEAKSKKPKKIIKFEKKRKRKYIIN